MLEAVRVGSSRTMAGVGAAEAAAGARSGSAPGRTCSCLGMCSRSGAMGDSAATPSRAVCPSSRRIVPVAEPEGAVARAGAVELSGVRQASGMVVAVGGANRPVAGGALQVNANTPLQTILQQRPSGVIRLDGETPAMTVPGAVGGPDLSYLHELVSASPQLVVSGFGAEQVRVLDRFGNVHTHMAVAQPGGGVTADVVLFDGFNDLSADAGLRGQTALMTNAVIRNRTVIHLSSTVSSYSFSCSIAPAQVTVATERTVTLSATVTASQPSPIEWGFVTTGTIPNPHRAAG